MYKMLISLRSLKLFGLCPRWPRRLMISVFNKQKESLCLIYRIESGYLLSVSQHIARGTPFKIVSPPFALVQVMTWLSVTLCRSRKYGKLWQPWKFQRNLDQLRADLCPCAGHDMTFRDFVQTAGHEYLSHVERPGMGMRVVAGLGPGIVSNCIRSGNQCFYV